jgi:hypothetical protein
MTFYLERTIDPLGIDTDTSRLSKSEPGRFSSTAVDGMPVYAVSAFAFHRASSPPANFSYSRKVSTPMD